MKFAKLGSCCIKIGSGATPKGGASVYVESGVALIRSQNVYNLAFSYNGLTHITDNAAKKLAAVTVASGDVLLNITGDSVARVCMVPDDTLPARVNQHVAIIRTNKDLSPMYLMYYLASPYMQSYMLNLASGKGASRNALTKGMIEEFLLPLPSIEEQLKISSILSSYDNLIENNNRRIKILEKMAENLYKEWFVRFRFPGYEQAEFENGIPKGWEIKKIKDCIKRLPYNRLYKASELKSEGKVIVIDQSTAEYLGFHDNEPSHSASYDLPIILFGDHSCKFKLMCSNFSLGENVIPFTVLHQEKDNTYFLYYAVHKLITTEEYKRHWNRLVNMKILKPRQCLQNKFAEFIIFMQKQKQSLFIQNQNLTKQRDLLLPRLMSGKLEV